MSVAIVRASSIAGFAFPPSSKSAGHRALICAALAALQNRDTGASCRYLIRNTAETERVRSILTAYSRSLPSQIAADYRFRLFYLRAVVDDEMRRCDGYPLRSKLCQECMREINDIYFADERTDGSVRAPVGC